MSARWEAIEWLRKGTDDLSADTRGAVDAGEPVVGHRRALEVEAVEGDGLLGLARLVPRAQHGVTYLTLRQFR